MLLSQFMFRSQILNLYIMKKTVFKTFALAIFTIITTGCIELPMVPKIICNTTIATNYAGGDCTIDYTIENPVSGGAVYLDTESCDWITDVSYNSSNSNSGTITFKTSPNTSSEERYITPLLKYNYHTPTGYFSTEYIFISIKQEGEPDAKVESKETYWTISSLSGHNHNSINFIQSLFPNVQVQYADIFGIIEFEANETAAKFGTVFWKDWSPNNEALYNRTKNNITELNEIGSFYLVLQMYNDYAYICTIAVDNHGNFEEMHTNGVTYTLDGASTNFTKFDKLYNSYR